MSTDAPEAATADPGSLSNRVARLLGVRIPIVQAPMTYIACAQLAAAVSNAGGLGIIETSSPQGRADLKRVRDLTDRPVGANVALAVRRDPSVIELLVEAGISTVFTSSGDPAVMTGLLHDAGMTVVHVVGSLRNALKAADAGVDGLVVEGVEGGGFKSARAASTLVLLPLVASRVSLPIIAAGGICDGPSMAAAVVLGAEGVQMGTRMLTSRESPLHENFKNAVLGADETGTVMLSVPGLPTMRVLRTETAERVLAAGRPEVGLDGIPALYFGGDMTASLANTGQVAGRIERVERVADIVHETWTGCRRILAEASSRADGW
ncbi:nitronate monooxygenase [Frankia sp. CNm7]|uniref:Nitronate monooxygenase n=1 Tax=Frankia nepalensis TaxID=1836974 RepID=A0A937URY5_9ACTN|nr:nitronate monooxygenase [Frankia nepalensis]MBL7502790.1 nitronate monooxygenase [Frankia nepalensis]MBL7512722.1 nitronate monooxygenase [Frankia nepalensis]MBL7524423.1 nitronate monooxygenase [Frankia nepalensis]MBL7628291.1 nitronate monooxygenase [Frankia nepalensis]